MDGRRNGLLRMLALLAVIFLVMAACTDDDDDGDDDDAPPAGEGAADVQSELFLNAQENGLSLGIADEAPYGFQDPDTGEATGEAPTVAKEILSRLGITQVDSSVVDFGALINGLNAGRYDIIAAGMFITEERASQALFTDPDYCVPQAFAVPEGNPNELTDFESVAANSDVQLGILRGAVELGFAQDAGVPEGQINIFDAQADMEDALTSGRINAFALTAISVRDFAADAEGFESTEPFLIEGVLNCGGYVFRFDNKDARDEFNAILLDMRENDEIAPLVSEFPLFEEIGAFDAAKGVTVEDIIGMPYDFAVDGGGDTGDGEGNGEEDGGTEE